MKPAAVGSVANTARMYPQFAIDRIPAATNRIPPIIGIIVCGFAGGGPYIGGGDPGGAVAGGGAAGGGVTLEGGGRWGFFKKEENPPPNHTTPSHTNKPTVSRRV